MTNFFFIKVNNLYFFFTVKVNNLIERIKWNLEVGVGECGINYTANGVGIVNRAKLEN